MRENRAAHEESVAHLAVERHGRLHVSLVVKREVGGGASEFDVSAAPISFNSSSQFAEEEVAGEIAAALQRRRLAAAEIVLGRHFDRSIVRLLPLISGESLDVPHATDDRERLNVDDLLELLAVMLQQLVRDLAR